MIVTFEGVDFSGKSTQAKLFFDRVRSEGGRAEFVRDPGGTAIGEQIRRILLDTSNTGMNERTELFLFSASRSQLVAEQIAPFDQKGVVVVCDRFYDSTTAYQGGGRGLSLEAITVINECASFGLVPAVTYLFDIPVSELERRIGGGKALKDRMESNAREFYDRVRRTYLALAESHPRFVVFDGTQPIPRLHEQVWEHFQRLTAKTV
jgi:dTMP kinase